MKYPTQELLKKLFNYDPKTGILTRKISVSRNTKVGDKLGCPDRINGYLRGRVDRKLLAVHRLVWILVYGSEPSFEIDHINGIKFDNRISNLREVTPSCNSRNRPMRSDNTTKLTGVFWDKDANKWRVEISINRKHKTLGRYESIFEAACVRFSAENKHGYTLRHGR